MATLHMEVETVRSAQSTMANTYRQLADLFQDVSSIVSRLQSAWIGPSTEEFFQEYAQWRSRMNAALEELDQMTTRLQAEIAEWEQAADRLTSGGLVGWLHRAVSDLARLAVQKRNELLGALTSQYGDTFRFGDQTMRFEDMSYEELLAAQTLLQMQGGSGPATSEQMEFLASYFNLDEKWVEDNLKTRSQGDLYNLLTQSGLVWDHGDSAVGEMPHLDQMQQEMMPATAKIPGLVRTALETLGVHLNVPDYQRNLTQARYGVNQQLLELSHLRESGEIDLQQYEDGREFIKAVHRGSLVSTVGTSLPARLISIGTTGLEDLLFDHKPPSHVMIGTGEGVLVSAESHGVVYRRAVDVFYEQGIRTIKEGNMEIEQIVVQEIPGDFNRDAAAAFAADKVGSAYDYSGLLTPLQAKRAWYCSEITLGALEAGGVRLDTREGPTPQDGAGVIIGGAMAIGGAKIPGAALAAYSLFWDARQISPEELTQARVDGKGLVQTYFYAF